VILTVIEPTPIVPGIDPVGRLSSSPAGRVVAGYVARVTRRGLSREGVAACSSSSQRRQLHWPPADVIPADVPQARSGTCRLNRT
jgi:hypothetical protein